MKNGIALITGATSGIGASYARQLARSGYDLIITGLPEHLDSVNIDEFRKSYNVKVDLIAADFRIDSDIILIESIIAGNDIEILVNNAGFGLGRAFWNNSLQDIESIIKVHIHAPVRFIYAALPNMMSKRRGIIINVSSLSSFLPVPRDSLYSATKLFQNSLMESLHISLGKMGIKIQVLCPGFVRTDFHKRASIDQRELERRNIIPWLQPDEVVAVSLKMLKRKNRVFVIPGVVNKLIRMIYYLIPERLYYIFASRYLS